MAGVDDFWRTCVEMYSMEVFQWFKEPEHFFIVQSIEVWSWTILGLKNGVYWFSSGQSSSSAWNIVLLCFFWVLPHVQTHPHGGKSLFKSLSTMIYLIYTGVSLSKCLWTCSQGIEKLDIRIYPLKVTYCGKPNNQTSRNHHTWLKWVVYFPIPNGGFMALGFPHLTSLDIPSGKLT